MLILHTISIYIYMHYYEESENWFIKYTFIKYYSLYYIYIFIYKLGY